MHNSYQNLLSIQSEIKKEFDNKPDKFIVPNIIAVSKAFSLEHINPLINAGHLHFGENKIQEAEKKWIDIKKINSTEIINIELLIKLKIINKRSQKLKILGTGHIKTKINLEANSISSSAKEKLEKIGGLVQIKK